MVPDTRDELVADAADERYRAAVDRAIDKALSSAEHPPTWPELLAATHGADPRLVAARLAERGQQVGSTKTQPDDPLDPPGPELHALDFEWYFDTRCAHALAIALARSHRSILCLGTPTVARALLDHTDVERVTLVDQNPLAHARSFGAEGPTSPRLRALVEDLAAARLDHGHYDAAIFDAPWYPASLHHWLSTAAYAVRPGGVVTFALMGLLHRPSAAVDRDAILEHARHHGQVRVEPAALRYHTPRFEREALATTGIVAPPGWRRADLVTLRRPVTNTARRPPAVPALPATSWDRFIVGQQVVHVDPAAPDEPGPLLEPIDGRADFRYASISTRDPKRSAIGLWTSRSRVARVRRPAIVAALLRQLADASQASDAAVLAHADERTLAGARQALGRII